LEPVISLEMVFFKRGWGVTDYGQPNFLGLKPLYMSLFY
jgi:hypothetical protein